MRLLDRPRRYSGASLAYQIDGLTIRLLPGDPVFHEATLARVSAVMDPSVANSSHGHLMAFLIWDDPLIAWDLALDPAAVETMEGEDLVAAIRQIDAELRTMSTKRLLDPTELVYVALVASYGVRPEFAADVVKKMKDVVSKPKDPAQLPAPDTEASPVTGEAQAPNEENSNDSIAS